MTATIKQRCGWAGSDPLMQQYHDTEWGVPQHDSRTLWEMLMLEGFQAGLSWSIVLKRRENFRKAFKDFDPAKVAKFTKRDIERLLQDEGIIRSRAKIAATINGAKIYNAMQAAGEDFSKWVWSFVNNKPIQNEGPLPAKTELSATISKALKNEDTNCRAGHCLRLDAGLRHIGRSRAELFRSKSDN